MPATVIVPIPTTAPLQMTVPKLLMDQKLIQVFHVKIFNTNNGKQNGIYWIRLTGMIKRL